MDKTNRALIGISAAAKAKGAFCRLRAEYTELYSDYFVKFIQDYHAAGIAIYSVTLQHEPQFDAAAYPCMRMDEDEQIRLVRALGPNLAANHSRRASSCTTTTGCCTPTTASDEGVDVVQNFESGQGRGVCISQACEVAQEGNGCLCPA